jgi:thiol-disulfide isomerase/thioredoxin
MRRSLIAAAPALALGAGLSNRANAQTMSDDLPDASTGWNAFAPVAPPPLAFQDAAGKNLTLAAFKGHVLLVNLWATWCGPCKAELPTFAALAPKLKQFGGLILPISIDVDGVSAVRPYFELRGIKTLPILVNPAGDDLDMMQTNGIPVTLVMNPSGKAVARLDGAADWNTKPVIAFLRHLAKSGELNPDGFTQA